MLFDPQDQEEEKNLVLCPYCQGKDIIKRGKRVKKYESSQLYFCKRCRKRFIAGLTKHKTFPVRLILEALTLYNRFYTFDEAAQKVSEKYGLKISRQNITNWLEDFKEQIRFQRMREFIEKKYKKKDIFIETKMFHGQIYDFKYHRAKLALLLEEDFKHYKFRPLQEFLELVSAECPHQLFRKSSQRASEYTEGFNLDQVKIIPKVNLAVQNTRFVLQAVANNKLRHQILQEFILVNDSVTVACEVPVLLDKDDLLHYKNQLGFQIPFTLEDNEVLTGHIDIIQVRNGMIHIMDYKPSAGKAKPIDQLTIYALALSRLTTLRLFHFKCAWFDEEHYFEFYPLHVVYKKKRRSRKK